MKDTLIKILEQCETKEIAKVFENYMQSIEVNKLDRRRKNNLNTYCICGKCTNWNRVECYYYKDSVEFSNENLEIVLRKRSGYYFIIARNGTRAFECSWDNKILAYDESLLNEIVEEHKVLFESFKQLVK